MMHRQPQLGESVNLVEIWSSPSLQDDSDWHKPWDVIENWVVWYVTKMEYIRESYHLIHLE